MTNLKDTYRIVFEGVDKLTSTLKRIKKDIEGTISKFSSSFKTSMKEQKQLTQNLEKNMKKSTKAIKKNVNESLTFLDRWKKGNIEGMQITAWWALSLMFFGMALQRFFEGVIRGAVGAFQKIMEMSELHGYAIQRLSILWTYLKFVIGSAINSTLEPLIPLISNINSKVTDWIDKNQKLVAGFFIIGAVLAFIIMLLGQFVFSLSTIVGAVRAVIAVLGGEGIIAALLNPWVLLIGVLIAVAMMFNNTRDAFLSGLKEIFDGFIQAFKGIWQVLKGFFYLLKGDTDKAIAYIYNGFRNLLIGLVRIIDGLLKALSSLLIAVGQALANALVKPIELALHALGNLIAWAARKLEGLPLVGQYAKTLMSVADALRGARINIPQVNLPTFNVGGMLESFWNEMSIPGGQPTTEQGQNYTPLPQTDLGAVSGAGTTLNINVHGLLTDEIIDRLVEEITNRINTQNIIGTNPG